MNASKTEDEISSWWGRMLVGRHPKRTLARILTLVLVVFVLFKFVFIPIRVEGISMEPTYHDGRVNLVSRLAYVKQKPRRGDVVAIRVAGERIMYMKRVIGLPGERVGIRRGIVYIDGKKLDEPYVQAPRSHWNEPETVLKEDQYLVIGDNRSMPQQWHTHGIVEFNRIAGKVLF
jgi:signal peptidase I